MAASSMEHRAPGSMYLPSMRTHVCNSPVSYICVLILLYVSAYTKGGEFNGAERARATIHVSSYYYTCPHTTISRLYESRQSYEFRQYLQAI